MNSPHSNLGSSTYQNPKGSNADVWLSSPSLGPTTSVYGSSSSGLSRVRLAKIRRSVSSQDPRSAQAPGSRRLDPGLIPTRPVSSNPVRATDIGGSGLEGFNYASGGNEAFVFGANMPSNFSSNLNFHRENSSGNLDSNTRLVDMNFSAKDSSFYRDGADRGFFSFQSDDKKSTSVENLASELPDKIRKLKIDGSGNAQTSSNAKGVNLQRENYSGNLNANTHSININFSGAESSFCSEGANSDFFVFESGNKKTSPVERSTSKLPAEIRKLKIDDYSGNPQSSNNAEGLNYSASERNGAHYRFGSGENFSNAFDVGVAKELPNVMKKLNIKDPLDCSRISENAEDHKKFAFGSSNKVGDSMAGKLKSTLHDRMRNLNIKEPSKSHGDNENMNVHVDSSDKKSFVSGNSRTISQLDEIRKISTMVANTSAQTKAGEFPINSANETWTHNFGNTKFHDGSTSIPMGFTFQAGEQRRTSSSDQVPQFNQNDNKLNGNEKKTRLDFTSKWSGLGTPHVEFKTPEPKGNLFSGLNRILEPKGESVRGSRTKKKKGKLSKPPLQTGLVQDSVLNEKTQEIDESFESYSPMDISPCKETVADNNHSRETSVTSDEAFHLGDNYASNESYPISHLNNAVDEDLVTEVDEEITELKGQGSSSCSNRGPYAEGPSEDYVSGAETESFKSAAEQLDYTSDTATSSDMFVTALDIAEVSSNARIDRKDSDDRMHFSFASISEDKGRNSFTFAAPSSAQVHSSAPTRQHRRKDRLKVSLDALSSTSNAKALYSSSSVQFFPFSGTSLLSPRQGKKGDVPTFLRKSGDQNEPVKDKEVKQETSSAVASIAAQEACEKWRMRGNQAYANGDLSKAEDYYTQGLNCISQQETSRSCLRALMLSYSNRAAARMSLGRMREALEDCKLAAALDPNFLRVQVRAANCYLALGEVESALPHFMKCLQSGSDVCVDRKLQLEASEGLEKAQKVSECMKLSAELLQHKTSTDAERALEIIAEALTISSYSEKLLQMKADALFMLQRYEDVIHLCKKTLFSAQMGASRHDIECHSQNRDDPEQGSSLFRIWKFSLIIKSYFLLGRLEEVLDFLKRQEDSVAIIMDRNKGQTLESVLPLVGTIRELLRHKSAGNEAFKSGKHAEALEHYTAAVSCNIESRPFVAICFGNRAASYRAMGHIIDAIADYSLAIALDGHYLKAISRRASLYETIRDYEQAAMDLRRLLSLLTKQVEEKAARCGTSDRMSCMDELRQTQHRLSAMEEEARKEIPLNIYLILGVEPSGTASEIRKAYRKAALKHHPDKVGQSLARSESGDDGLWKEIAEEVHKDADRLFKMIGEAYAILSDPSKRSRYDLEEEMRNGHNRGSASNITRTHTAAQKHPFERSNSSSRRNWQEAYTSYRNTQPRG